MVRVWQERDVVNENLVRFFRSHPEVFPLASDADVDRLLVDAFEQPASILPIPAKIFLADDVALQGYGFPLTRTQILDDLEAKLQRWLDNEIAKKRSDESLMSYCEAVMKVARNAMQASILSDYHSVFWLVLSGQVARAFTAFPRRAMDGNPTLNRDQAEAAKHALAAKWTRAIRESVAGEEKKSRFLKLILDNPLIVAEEFIGSDLRELRSSHPNARKWIDGLRARVNKLMTSDRIFRRAISQLGYPASAPPPFIALLDRRVQQLAFDEPQDEALSKRLLEHTLVHHLRRGAIWMKTTTDGDNVSESTPPIVYSRAIRPMNFGRRGIVEPIIYRFGLVYDITSFTQTLGELARAGKEEEQTSYKQMLDFQRQLADVSHRNGLQFEKFLGDGAFYTTRRAMRVLQAAIEIQSGYSQARANGFAFDKGMRIALNYGYYRLLPMQVTLDGNEIKEFYGPGIVELSRLKIGRAHV